MRQEFEMTEAQLNAIMEAGKPVPYMVFGGRAPRSPQENANAAWAALGAVLGFEPMTVQPARGKGQRFFTAMAIQRKAPEDAPSPCREDNATGYVLNPQAAWPFPTAPVPESEPAFNSGGGGDFGGGGASSSWEAPSPSPSPSSDSSDYSGSSDSGSSSFNSD